MFGRLAMGFANARVLMLVLVQAAGGEPAAGGGLEAGLRTARGECTAGRWVRSYGTRTSRVLAQHEH